MKENYVRVSIDKMLKLRRINGPAIFVQLLLRTFRLTSIAPFTNHAVKEVY